MNPFYHMFFRLSTWHSDEILPAGGCAGYISVKMPKNTVSASERQLFFRNGCNFLIFVIYYF